MILERLVDCDERQVSRSRFSAPAYTVGDHPWRAHPRDRSARRPTPVVRFDPADPAPGAKVTEGVHELRLVSAVEAPTAECEVAP